MFQHSHQAHEGADVRHLTSSSSTLWDEKTGTEASDSFSRPQSSQDVQRTGVAKLQWEEMELITFTKMTGIQKYT